MKESRACSGLVLVMAIAMVMTFGAAPASAALVCADSPGSVNTCVAGNTIETKQTCDLNTVTIGNFTCDGNADEWHIVLNGVTGTCPSSGVTLTFTGGIVKTAAFVKKTGNTCHYSLAGNADDGATALESATVGCGTGFTYNQFNVSHIPCSGDSAPPGVLMCKFYDGNLSGTRDTNEPAIVGWEVTDGILSKLTRAASIPPFSPTNLPLPEGCRWFSVTAGQDVDASECNFTGSGWIQTAKVVTNDADSLTDGIQAADCDPLNNPTACTRVDFGNVCLGGGGGKTLGFWSNKNGLAQINDGGTAVPELTMLGGLCLVANASGGHFVPATAAQLQSWLLSATATNMAYMLSAQLAAMELNVEANFVTGTSVVYAPGCGSQGSDFITINDLMTTANQALCDDQVTPSGDPNRATQECLKNALDRANNNLNFVQAGPGTCASPIPSCNTNAIP